MPDRHQAIDVLRQLAPRETARMAGALAPAVDEAMLWLKRIVAAEFWDGQPQMDLPLPDDKADEIFTKVNETAEDLTRYQLWTVLTDPWTYPESSTTSHLNNAHPRQRLPPSTTSAWSQHYSPTCSAYFSPATPSANRN